ncbi:MAG: hypothetical protein V4555_21140 [Acidobacteriota bacterium]
MALAAASLLTAPASARAVTIPGLPTDPSATTTAPATTLPDAPSAILAFSPSSDASSSSLPEGLPESPFAAFQHDDPQKTNPNQDVDADGKPIPLNRQQPHRILGIMPNFRTVSAGSKPHPPGWKYNFTVANHQALDYSTFIFLGLTSITAEGMDSHPALGKGIDGFWNYTWRGFLDKTDNTYLSAWLLPSLLHEDTRYYPLGSGHSIFVRTLYVISRQAVTRTYGGSNTPNIAGLGGKVITQIVSRSYYPSSATSFSALATKFGYSAMRDIGFSAIREFYPDAAAHFIRKHREKVARQAARDAQSATPAPAKP